MLAIRPAQPGGPEVLILAEHPTPVPGPDELLVAAKLGFAAEKPLAEVAAEIDIVEARVRRAVPTARSIYFEPDVYTAGDSPHPPTEEIVIRSVD